MDRDLEGKTALVTGSGRNNGRAILLELAAKGANVVVNARSNKEEAEMVAKEAEELGVASLIVLGDVSKQETVDEIRARAEERFGGIDISVSNAAIRPYQSFFDMPVEDFVNILDMQLTASFRLAKAVVPHMVDRKWGRIIHITGPDSFSGIANRAHNVAAKGGIRALTKALAIELAPHGITVNDVAPGRIDHPGKHLTHPVVTIDPAEKPKRTEAERLAPIPVGRGGLPEDVAYACGFLASPRASFYTGTVMCCFGGQWMIP